MITVKVSKTEIQIDGSFEPVTSGAVNAFPCVFEFGPDWDNMVKTATFRAGKRAVSVVVPEDGIVNIPWEVIEYDGLDLYVGVTGMAGQETPEKTDDIVLPTVWALIGTVRNGAAICGTGNLPTPGVYEQLTVEIADLKKTKQDKLSGAGGQIVGFDEDGNPIAIDMPETGTVSIAVDSTTTLPAGSEATVENVGTEKEARLAFGIPAGADGAKVITLKTVMSTSTTPTAPAGGTFTVFNATETPEVGDIIIVAYKGKSGIAGRTWIRLGVVDEVTIVGDKPNPANDYFYVIFKAVIETTGLPGTDGEPGQDGIDALTYGALIQHYPEPDMVMEIPSKYFNRAATEGETFSGVFSEGGKSAIGILSVKTYTPPAAESEDAMSSVEVLEYAETKGEDGLSALVCKETGYVSKAVPAVGDNLSLNENAPFFTTNFNRKPVLGDHTMIILYGATTFYGDLSGRSWIVDAEVTVEGEGGIFALTARSVIETTGMAGVSGATGANGVSVYTTKTQLTQYSEPSIGKITNVSISSLSTSALTPTTRDVVVAFGYGKGSVAGRSWIISTTINAITSSSVSLKTIAVLETTGLTGPTGPAALVYEGTAIYSTEPTDIDMPVSLFNRTPAEDDYVSFIARGEGDVEGRSWLCSGLVASVDDTQAHVIVASVVETTGAQGPAGSGGGIDLSTLTWVNNDETITEEQALSAIRNGILVGFSNNRSGYSHVFCNEDATLDQATRYDGPTFGCIVSADEYGGDMRITTPTLLKNSSGAYVISASETRLENMSYVMDASVTIDGMPYPVQFQNPEMRTVRLFPGGSGTIVIGIF